MSSFLASTRASFPSLASESKQIFFDNAGGSQTLGSVVDAISDYLRNSNVQMGASYKVGKIASERFRKGYAAAAGWVGAGVEEIGELLTPCYHL
jgi:selenocysteine lyase/cysteine desulfurase